MENTERELAAHFSAMEDDALLAAAVERGELSALAVDVLSAELRSRGLAPPPYENPLTKEDEHETQVWVTVDRFRDLSAAIVARSALEAAEIPCFLRDENTVRMDWQISNFIGGMRLEVVEQDREAALQVLGGLSLDEVVEEMSDEVCPVCGSVEIRREAKRRGLALAALYFFSVPISRGKLQWRCDTCGAQWDDTVRGGD